MAYKVNSVLVDCKATSSFLQDTLGLGRPSETHTNVMLLPTNVVMLVPMVAVYSTLVINLTEDSPIVIVGEVGSVNNQYEVTIREVLDLKEQCHLEWQKTYFIDRTVKIIVPFYKRLPY